MPLLTPHLWIPDTSLITDPALALTMMARTFALRTMRAAEAAGNITFIGSATGSVTDGGTPSITLSSISGLSENDLVLVFCSTTGGTPATPGGWTSITTLNDDSGVYALARKFMTSSPDSSVSFWDSGGTASCGAAIAMAFRGVNLSTPIDVTTTVNATEPPDPPAITPNSNNCAIVVFSGNGAVDTTIGTISGYSTPVTITAVDAEAITAAAAYRILAGGSMTSENPAAWSSWNTVSGFGFSHSLTVALRPA